MPRRVLGASRPLTQVTGAGKASTDDDAFLQLPQKGTLTSVTARASTAGQAPVFVSIAGSGTVGGFHLSGWVRGSTGTYLHSDPLYWTGEAPLMESDDNLLFVGFRNDTGGTISIIVEWTVVQ